ncbi:hypothetical protein J4E93_010572 [Alternaria ventricosa]|uniref:uncharacterized protein n=1 Tax=Alternaria ventricosa TaxID=1187951 RepID=UPI0020C58FC9|nr:uncharacterized protein J4E93_010572 [Alternaria ventricosa]KAI4637172.1 hypothetical protein J4E93_010572 [Alternaria ventricosa]
MEDIGSSKAMGTTPYRCAKHVDQKNDYKTPTKEPTSSSYKKLVAASTSSSFMPSSPGQKKKSTTEQKRRKPSTSISVISETSSDDELAFEAVDTPKPKGIMKRSTPKPEKDTVKPTEVVSTRRLASKRPVVLDSGDEDEATPQPSSRKRVQFPSPTPSRYGTVSDRLKAVVDDTAHAAKPNAIREALATTPSKVAKPITVASSSTKGKKPTNQAISNALQKSFPPPSDDGKKDIPVVASSSRPPTPTPTTRPGKQSAAKKPATKTVSRVRNPEMGESSSHPIPSTQRVSITPPIRPRTAATPTRKSPRTRYIQPELRVLDGAPVPLLPNDPTLAAQMESVRRSGLQNAEDIRELLLRVEALEKALEMVAGADKPKHQKREQRQREKGKEKDIEDEFIFT